MARGRGWGSAVKTPYRGVVYASKSEANYARHLDLLVKAKKVKRWEGQARMALMVNGTKVCDMVPDFLVTWKDGTTEYVEVKGMQTAVYRLKLKLLRALHPDIQYRIVPAREALNL